MLNESSITLEDFDRLECDWNALVREAGNCSVFALPQWQRMWWATFGANADLRLLALRRSQRLETVFPLMQRGDELCFLGNTDLVDYHEIPCINDRADNLQALIDFLVSDPGWRVMRLESLPQVTGLAPVNRLLVPERLQSDAELRKIAARLHADVLIVYTVDSTSETVWRKVILGVLSLGFASTHETIVTSTASALLLDTRTGYVYGSAESTERVSPRHDVWNSVETGEDAWRNAEKKAMTSLAGELERTWSVVVATYAQDAQGTR
jgi:hypothetical protein